MDINEYYQIIISEPLYLSIAILLILSIIYSVLKKFFKLLLITLTCLILYLGYLIFTNQDLPGESDDIIYPFIDSTIDKANKIIDEVSN